MVQWTTTELNDSRYFDMDCFGIRHVTLCWIFQAPIRIQPCYVDETHFLFLFESLNPEDTGICFGMNRAAMLSHGIISDTVTFHWTTPEVISVPVSGPLFPKRWDILPSNLPKYRSREIRVGYWIIFKFHEVFQSDTMILSSNI